MSVTLQVTKAGNRLRRDEREMTRPTMKAEVWSKAYGVPLAEKNRGWGARLWKGMKRQGLRLWKTLGPDKALAGLNAPIPVEVLVARPIMTRRG